MMNNNDLWKNKDTKTPLYVSVYNEMLNMIHQNKFKLGERLPSENVLAKQFGVSRGTLRQALFLLQEDGVIFNYQGKGNYMTTSHHKIELGLEKVLNTPLEFNVEEYDDILVDVKFQPPTKKLQELLKIDNSKLIAVFDFIYKIKDQNACCVILFMTYEILSKYNINLEDKNMLKDFIHNYINEDIKNIQTKVKIVNAREAVAQKLNISEGEHLLFLDEIMMLELGIPVISARSYYRPEFYEFYINRK